MRGNTLAACDFGYGGASFQLAIEDCLLDQGRPVEAESICPLDLYVHKLAGKLHGLAY
jgi:hypothetical protein